MPPRPRLIFLLNTAQRRLLQWMSLQQAQAASTHGQAAPTAAQGGALFVLAKRDGATMGELASALDLAPSATSGLVQRMEALGWVQRQPSLEDGRTLRVWLQAGGQAQLPALKHALTRINDRLCAGFSDSELHTVARWLQHVQQLDTRPGDQGTP